MSQEKTQLTPQQKKKLALQIVIPLLVAIFVVGIVLMAVYFATRQTVEAGAGITMPILTLQEIGGTSIDLDRDNGYRAHPDIVMTDDGNLIMMYPSSHGRGALVTQVSSDYGYTWEYKTDTPESWTTSQETPTLYNIDFVDANGDKNGASALVLVSGCPDWHVVGNWQDKNGFNYSISTDNGVTWSEFENWYGQEWAGGESGAYDGIVAMSALVQLKENGKYINKWMGTFHDHNFHTYKTFLTFEENEDGTLKTDENGRYIGSWSEPEYLLAQWREYEKLANLCELEIIRTPNADGSSLDGDTLVMIARANSRKTNSMILTSTDEGQTWSEPKELPLDLTGDRHKAEYDATTGKLVISYRQITAYKPSALHPTNTYVSLGWVAWVGTFEQLLSDGIGDTLVLLSSSRTADCGYAGTICKDGEFFMASYGLFDDEAEYAYIMGVRFTTEGIYSALANVQ